MIRKKKHTNFYTVSTEELKKNRDALCVTLAVVIHILYKPLRLYTY